MTAIHKNLTIRTSLTLVISLFVVLLVVASVLGMTSLKSSNDSLRSIYAVDTPTLTELRNSAEELQRMRQALATMSSYLSAGNTAELTVVMKRYDGYRTVSDKLWQQYMNRPKLNAQEEALAKQADVTRTHFVNDILAPTASALKSGDLSTFNGLQASSAPPVWAKFTKTLNALQAIHVAHQKDLYESAQHTFMMMRAILGGAVALALLVGIFARQALIGAIVKPVNQAVSYFEKIASGDLSTAIAVSGKNEMSNLLAGLKRMQEALVKTVRVVRDSSEAISSGAGEIANGNADLSSRTEEQASSLEETAASMEQLTSAVKQNADNAKQASQLAVTASETAARGGAVVSQVVDTMHGITESSNKVTDILSVIDGIAFQTNILALNAAVEAARAGEQGRGFAVVAGEVRTLAQRSAAAAKEIKGLIDDSAQRVQAGSALVARAGQTMDEIVKSITKVTDIMGEISAASTEQSTGIEEVNRAVTQMDEMTQQNAALVEEAAAAAGSLEEQARHLRNAVAVFRLSGADASAPAAAAATPMLEDMSAEPALARAA